MQIVQSRIAAAAGKMEPQRKNNFMVQIAAPAGIPGGAGKADMAMIEQSLASFAFPSWSVELGETPWINEIRKWAKGPVKFEASDLVLNDYVDMGVADAIQKWSNAVFNLNTGQMGLAEHYKSNGTLILFAPDGSKDREWTLKQVWPRVVKIGDGDMSDGGQVQITVTLEMDWVEPKKLTA